MEAAGETTSEVTETSTENTATETKTPVIHKPAPILEFNHSEDDPGIDQDSTDEKSEDETNFKKSFKDQLPEWMLKHPAFASVETEEEVREVFNRLKLEQQEDEIKSLEDIPDYDLVTSEGTPADPESTKIVQQLAKTSALKEDQAQALYDHWTLLSSQVKEHLAAISTEYAQESKKYLEKKWGDDFQRNIDNAQQAIRRFASPSFVEFIKKTGLGHAPEMVEVLAKIGGALAEDRTILGRNKRGRTSTTTIPKLTLRPAPMLKSKH